MYTEQYESSINRCQFPRLVPGKRKVAIDAFGCYVIGYAQPGPRYEYFLCPFFKTRTELGVTDVERVKVLIKDNCAITPVPIEKRDPLNNRFFKPIGFGNLRSVKVMNDIVN